MSVDFADSLSKIPDQLVQGVVLRSGGEIAIEIADQTDAEGDVIEIVAVDVSAGELDHPPIPNLDLAIT